MSQDQDGIDKDRRAAGPEETDEVTDAPDIDPTLDDESPRPARRARRSNAETTEADDANADLDSDTDISDTDIADDDAEPDDGSAPVTAGGSFRAAARRGGPRAAQATTEKKDAPTRRRDAEERTGMIARIGRYVREVVAELRKVIWPSRKQWATFTFVVIVFLVVMVALVSGLDVLFHLIVGQVFG